MLDVRRFLNDYVVVASLFPSVASRLASPLLTYHLSPSPPAPCSCAISSLNITEIYEQTCFGNWRDRHDRPRCREATFGKGRFGARRGSRSSQSEKTIRRRHCTRAIRV